ncbi:clostripain-related cysteine peptidase [Thiothrix nivea]|uniref:Peptidase C11 clostripain n=1 Tax=Thiothrix nivea (strain ATCC 35100 / DSM 5205 / JP2) TaxID=870187 RepID=A0A656HGD7_THINJ|nr:clostripain-related cysteine peptidase [Thiothrix nivea]EIJ35074.1 peptidase C11 clostripain [Thiothrix nivea DSM 5205]
MKRHAGIFQNMGMRLTALCLAVIMAGCGGGGSDATTGNPTTTPTTNNGGSNTGSSAAAKHTVLVYVVGSDLESNGENATKDLAEMAQVGSSDNLKIVVETGGADADGWRTVQRHLVQQDGPHTLADLGSLNMGLTSTLQDFVTWGIQTYPADKYTLVMWDHGAGATTRDGIVFGNDEVHSDGLSLTEIDQALKNSLAATGKQLEVLGFDACLMATLEVANMAKSHAKYLVASEEIEPGTGWDYSEWLKSIQQNPAITGDAVGKSIADSYLASTQGQSGITLSVTDLGKVAALQDAFGAFASKAQANMANDATTTRLPLAKARNLSASYGKDAAQDNYTDMVDLKHLMQNLTGAYPTESANVISQLGQAVVHKIASPDQSNANGLTVYMPHKQINSSDASKQTALKDRLFYYTLSNAPASWLKLLQGYVQDAYTDTLPPVFQNETRNGDTITATVSDGDLAWVFVITGELLADNRMRVWMQDSPDNTGDANNITYGLEPTAVALGGHPVAPYLEDIEPVSQTEYYDIPITYNGEKATMKVSLSRLSAVPEPKFEGLFLDTEGESAPRAEPLEAGAVIQPLFQVVNILDASETLEPYGSSFVVAGNETFSSYDLPQGNYAVMMGAADFSGNVDLGKLYTVSVPAASSTDKLSR